MKTNLNKNNMDYIKEYLKDNLTMIDNFKKLILESEYSYKGLEPDFNYSQELSFDCEQNDFCYNAYWNVYDYINGKYTDPDNRINEIVWQILCENS